MVPTPGQEPTSQDVAITLQDLATKLDQLALNLNKISVDNDKFNDKFENYQRSTQWVVQLAFTLMASTTITVIFTSIFRR